MDLLLNPFITLLVLVLAIPLIMMLDYWAITFVNWIRPKWALLKVSIMLFKISLRTKKGKDRDEIIDLGKDAFKGIGK